MDDRLYKPIKSGYNILFSSPIPRYLDLGTLNFEGKFAKAIKLGEELLSLNPPDDYCSGIYINLMVSYFKLRDKKKEYLEQSSFCAKRAILLGHNTGYAHERLVINLEKSGFINQAIQLCNIILLRDFRFSRNGCGNSMDFHKRKDKLLKKVHKSVDSSTDILFTESEIRVILSYRD